MKELQLKARASLARGVGRIKKAVNAIRRYETIPGKEKMLSLFDEELMKIEAEIKFAPPSEIPHLFSRIPLDVFGKLLLEVPPELPNIKTFFPSMASEEVQRSWTGASGEVLLRQSLVFVKTMISGYAAITGNKIENAYILDYGCGWGRLIRPLYKFVSFEHIYAVDPYIESINECEHHGIKGNLAVSDWVPTSLPFDRQFDLIFAFSVFTHISEKTAHAVLNTLRKYITKDGLLVITIRPREYWYVHDHGTIAPQMIKKHDENGFAFTPFNLAPVDGDFTYGNVSMSLAYFESHFPQWRLEAVERNDEDAQQILLFCKPV